MQDVDVRALATQVLWAAFALSVLLGAIMQRTRFCTMGAVDTSWRNEPIAAW